MSMDYISLILRFTILFFTAMASEIAISKRFYSLGIFLFAFWITIFRLAFYRAATAYLGVFQHESSVFVNEASHFIQSSNLTNITDTIILIGVILLFLDISHMKRWDEGRKLKTDNGN